MQLTPTQQRACAWCPIAASVVFACWQLAPVPVALVVAAGLACALTPLINRLGGPGRGCMPRTLAVCRLKPEPMASALYNG